MTIFARLEQWKKQGAISPAQHAHLVSLSRRELVSAFIEISILLYAGVLRLLPDLAGPSAHGRTKSVMSSS
jgi:hypothetical protein